MKKARPIPEGLVIPAAKPRPEPINNAERVAAFRAAGGHILHFRPERNMNGRISRGGTLAFVVKGSRVQIASAVQHRADGFSKKIGTKTAIEHFLAGKHITLPLRPGLNNVMNDLKYSVGFLFT